MRKVFNVIGTIFLLIFLIGISIKAGAQESLKIWYDAPAQSWMNEALPIGNGYMGVMFFGGIEEERLQFSEESLWTGGPGSGSEYNFGIREGAYQFLPEIRALLKKGDKDKAYLLTEKYLSGIIHPRAGNDFGDYGAQQCMGDIFVKCTHEGLISNYKRELDLSTGMGSVSYTAGNVLYKRTYFGCYPSRAMVYHFSNDAKAGASYQIKLTTPHPVDSIVFKKSVLHCYAHLEDNGQKFVTSLIVDTDGRVFYKDSLLHIDKASVLTIKHIAHTDYNNNFPEYHNQGFLKEAESHSGFIQREDFESLKQTHLDDYCPLFNRLGLELKGISRDDVPTDERIKNYHSGQEDMGLEVLFFQYARYLMLSASRPGTMPMHLQGKWNHSTRPPWACDYHTNINLQMLYWPAEVLNLSECHLPLFDYMKGLMEPGRKAASAFFGARGWIVNTMNNAYGYTSPGWGLPWGYFPAGAAWLCRHAWEHFLFTQDSLFLKDVAFPMMNEASLFWKDYLTEDSLGFLVSVPSFSPEHGGISSGASMDHQIVWDLFNNCYQAAETLDLPESQKAEYHNLCSKICPLRIGRWGQLQEWVEDIDDPQNKHRHVSHLYALYPGNQIFIDGNQDYKTAALKSLEARGMEGTGWSYAWKMNLYARLGKGGEAYSLLRHLLQPIINGDEDMGRGGVYSNLLCAHPPFQLDGNMGGAAGMAEMLLQSNNDTLLLLPALPSKWQEGKLKGFKARGGFEIGFSWSDGNVVSGEIRGMPGMQGYCKAGNTVFSFVIPETGIFIF